MTRVTREDVDAAWALLPPLQPSARSMSHPWGEPNDDGEAPEWSDTAYPGVGIDEIHRKRGLVR